LSGLSEIVEMGMSNTFERQHFNQQVPVFRRVGLCVEHRQGIFALAAPNERLGLQDPELPGPLSVGALVSPAAFFGFMLALKQIPVPESLPGSGERRLRVFPSPAGRFARQDERGQSKRH
jgi:hypothetical protein